MSDATSLTPPLFPTDTDRLRRLRGTPALRSLVRENSLSMNDFIYPVFICDGQNQKIDISSMPGQFRMSLDLFEDEVGKIAEAGIRSILLFGVPDKKDSCASEAMKSNGLIQKAVEVARKVAPQLVVMTDVCVCEFTDHGHCGVIENGDVLNDPSLDMLCEMAVSHAQAGAHVVAPSAMMDGQVAAIRHALDNEGFESLPIMAYAAKFSSKFYGPFREAANSAPQFGDRKSYQMDPANLREARREVISDAEQGGDIIMVKPGLSYLDVVAMARATVDNPIAVYNVSGEYSMVKAAAANGWIDEKEVALEILTAFKRAGADLIITYFAKDAAQWIK